MKRGVLPLLMVLMALLLCVQPVAAADWHVDGDTLYYDGVPIQWPEDEQAQQDLLASLDAYGPPPMPPDWPVDVVEPKAPVAETLAAQDYDSGPSIQDVMEAQAVEAQAEPANEPTPESTPEPEPIVYDWTGEDYWRWT